MASLGSERGIITKVEVDVTLERAIGVERGPAAAAGSTTSPCRRRSHESPGVGYPFCVKYSGDACQQA
jgi:hypothetical protein